MGCFGIYLYLDELRNGEENRRKQREEDEIERQNQLNSIQEKYYKNRFGVATNPGQSMEVFIDFIKNGEAI